MSSVVDSREKPVPCAVAFTRRARDYGPGLVGNRAGKASRGLAVEKRTDGKYKRTENNEQRFLQSASKSPLCGPRRVATRTRSSPRIQLPITRRYPDTKSTFKTFCAQASQTSWLVGSVVVTDNGSAGISDFDLKLVGQTILPFATSVNRSSPRTGDWLTQRTHWSGYLLVRR